MGERFLVKILSVSFIGAIGFQQVEPLGLHEENYIAAVVEYEGDKDTVGLTAAQILWRNAENFRTMIHEAASFGADIVILAEYGLTSTRALPRQVQLIGPVGQNPCNESSGGRSSEVIRYLACAARSAKTYVVIDILELVPSNSSNPSERDFVYNTALAFDRNGAIVAKYHKSNVASGEAAFVDEPQVTEIISFPTDFGVEFGMMICFDLLFEQPAKSLLERGVRHFVLPTAWIDELPYLFAVQSQTFWASSASSILHASGLHSPQIGAMGSGIYMPSGQPLNYIFNPTSGTRIVYARVPKNPNSAAPIQPFAFKLPKFNSTVDHFYHRQVLKNFTVSPPLDWSTAEQELKICDKGCCCSLRYSYTGDIQRNDTVMHRLMVLNGQRGFPEPVKKTNALQICSVVRCLNDSLDSCNLNQPPTGERPLSFRRFRLVAEGITKVEFFRPGLTTLDVNLDLISIDLFVREDSEDGSRNGYIIRRHYKSNILMVLFSGILAIGIGVVDYKPMFDATYRAQERSKDVHRKMKVPIGSVKESADDGELKRMLQKQVRSPFAATDGIQVRSFYVERYATVQFICFVSTQLVGLLVTF